MLRWAPDGSGRIECDGCHRRWTPAVSGVLPARCNVCFHRNGKRPDLRPTTTEGARPGPRLTPNGERARRVIRAAARQGTIDHAGMQAELARMFRLSRQRISQIVKEERESLANV